MPQIRHDVFPAIITIAGPELELSTPHVVSAPPSPGAHQVHSSRIIVTESHVLIARDSVNGPELIFSEPYAPTTLERASNKALDSYLTTVSGKRLAYKRDDGCGCGSRLRSWNPFNGIVYSSQDPR